jgi:hypothetical protein
MQILIHFSSSKNQKETLHFERTMARHTETRILTVLTTTQRNSGRFLNIYKGIDASFTMRP